MSSAQFSRPNVRLAVLFIATVLLPCTVLVVLGLRGMAQEKELAMKHIVDVQAAQLADVRRNTEAYLKAIALDEVRAWRGVDEATHSASRIHSATRLIALAGGDRLSVVRAPGRTAPTPPSEEWESEVRRAERAEFTRGERADAIRGWRSALAGARVASESASARLGLARVLTKHADSTLAAALYREVLQLPIDVSDDHDIPFALYAAVALARSTPAVVEAHLSRLESLGCCRSTEALYMLRDAHAAVRDSRPDSASRSIEPILSERIRNAEQADALREQFGRLRFPVWREGNSGSDAPSWSIFGQRPWLVSVIAVGSDSFAIALSATTIVDSLNTMFGSAGTRARAIRISGSADAAARRVSPFVAGLSLASGDEVPQPPDWAEPAAYVGMLVLVLGVALFGAYVLWIDVRRERRLAAMRSDFVASVSHELKTPLTAIRLYAETLAESSSGDPVDREQYLNTIIGESERLTRLLNNVLDLSKIERNQKAYRRTPTVLEDVVRRAARTLQYPLAQQGFRLLVEADAPSSITLADADAIEQAILNLVANAMKYSGESRDIALRLRRIDVDAVIEVQDWGIGIPAEHQPFVIEKFYRVPCPDNVGIPGTGLGLTLVDHIAKAHDGRVEISSAPQRGSTISIRIPIVEVS